MAIPYVGRRQLEILRARHEDINFLLDSGAFTAWKSGRTIGLDEYCAFVESLPITPFGYFTLDVIGDPVGTRRNYDEIRRRGLRPIPIFTRGSDWSELDELFRQTDYIGVGGGTGTTGFPLFIRDVSRRVHGTDRRVHWLGFTNKDYVAKWRPFSVDSSSANNGTKWHNLCIYRGNGRMGIVNHRAFRDDTAGAIAFVRDFAEWCSEDVYGLRDDTEWNMGKTSDRITVKAWTAYEIDMRLSVGTMMFQSVVNPVQIENTIACWNYCAERLLKGDKPPV